MNNQFTVIIFCIIFLTSFAAAAPLLRVEEIETKSVLISEFGGPAEYELVIDNLGDKEMFEVYTLVGIRIEPTSLFELPHGITRLNITAQPSEKIIQDRHGLFTFEYQIKGKNSGIYKDKMMMKIVPLNEVIQIQTEPLNLGDGEAVIVLKNVENVDVSNMTLGLESPFFSTVESLSLGPYGEKKISVPLNLDSQGIVAGHYIVDGKLSVKDVKTEIEGFIEFVEKEGIQTDESSNGLIVKETDIVKRNVGNVPAPARVVISKDIISRLFTKNEPEPLVIQRDGFGVTYIWERNLNPGESYVVHSSTNYTVPFVLIILVILVGLLVAYTQRKSVDVRKNVSLVRTRGGEFALKVNLRVKAHQSVENIQLTDTLPHMTRLYEKFGKKPDKIDAHSGHMHWSVGNLSRGAERVYSYIIYSKINVIGRFELPPARALFEKDGKNKWTLSNRTFFVAEKD